jgi:hypothetical protein
LLNRLAAKQMAWVEASEKSVIAKIDRFAEEGFT